MPAGGFRSALDWRADWARVGVGTKGEDGMATLPPRELKIGKIVDKTLGVIEHIALPALLFVIGFTAINSVLAYFLADPTSPLRAMQIWLLQLAVGAVVSYLLLDVALRHTGLHSRTERQAFLLYLGLYALYTLGVIVGFILIIVPGLIFMARWSIAQPLLVGRGTGVMEAFGESWERTKGNEFQIIVAALALLVLPITAAIVAIAFMGAESLGGIVVSQLATSVATLATLAMGVAIYGLMGGAREAAGTFR